MGQGHVVWLGRDLLPSVFLYVHLLLQDCLQSAQDWMVDSHSLAVANFTVPCFELGGRHGHVLLVKLSSYDMGQNMVLVSPSILACFVRI